MALLLTHQGILSALSALGSNPETLKGKFVDALLQHFDSDEAVSSISEISPDQLIPAIWGINDPREIKRKRKNFSSLKSALNKELKELDAAGNNPEGIILGRNNTFEISAEKKEDLLREMGISGGVDFSLADEYAAFKKEFGEIAEKKGWHTIKDVIGELETQRELVKNLDAQLRETKGLVQNLTGELEASRKALEKLAYEEGKGAKPGDGNENGAGPGQDPAAEEPGIGTGEDAGAAPGEAQEAGEEEDLEVVELDEDETIEEAGPTAAGEPGIGTDEEPGAGPAEELEAGMEVELGEDSGAGAEEGSDAGEQEELEVIELAEDEVIEEARQAAGEEQGAAGGENQHQVHQQFSGPSEGRSLLDALSEYLDADEALQNQAELLRESLDYTRQILSRFTPHFIKIPAGIYIVGAPAPQPNEPEQRSVSLSAFYIGEHPVTNDLFDLFIRETGYETEAEKAGYGRVFTGRFQQLSDGGSGRQIFTLHRGKSSNIVGGANWRHPHGPDSSLKNRHNHPVVQVSRKDALAFASWAGKRLPSEEEWEAAARGGNGLLFPWGNEENPQKANLESSLIGDLTPVDRFAPDSASPFGILDLIGNVFEWTSSRSATQEGFVMKSFILKGGSWISGREVSAISRMIEKESFWSNTVGFRCAVSA